MENRTSIRKFAERLLEIEKNSPGATIGLDTDSDPYGCSTVNLYAYDAKGRIEETLMQTFVYDFYD